MRYLPRPKNKTADILIFSGFLAGILMYAFASVDASVSVILKIAGILFFTMALYFFIRYRLSTFLYEIKPDAKGEECLFISRLRGKDKYIAEFCMPLSSICELREIDTKNEKTVKGGNGISVYKYNVTMDPDRVCEIKFSYHAEIIAVVFEPCEEMISLIKMYLP